MVTGLALPWQSNSDADLLYRLHYATDGVIANIMNLMRGAGRLAHKQGADRLDVDVLATVFDKQLAKHLGKIINPFRGQPEPPSPQLNAHRLSETHLLDR